MKTSAIMVPDTTVFRLIQQEIQ